MKFKELFLFLKFTTLGTLGSIFDLAVYFILVRFGMGYLIAYSISFAGAIIIGFFVHKNWTFNSKGGRRKMVYYFITSIFFFCTNIVFMYLYKKYGVGLPIISMDDSAKLVVGAVLLYPGYTLNRAVFKD